MIDPIATGKQIRMYMELRHLSVQDVADALSLEYVQSLYHWLNGKSLPSLDNLYMLSQLLHVFMDDLVVGKDESILNGYERSIPQRAAHYLHLMSYRS